MAGFSRLGLAEIDLTLHEEEGGGKNLDTFGSADDTTANGPFKTAEELQKVKGIGPALFAKITALITAGP